MQKNFVKIIFVVALFVGTFFVADSAEALQCCLTKSVSDSKPSSCVLKGSNPCNFGKMLLPCDGGGATKYVFNPDTKLIETQCVYGKTLYENQAEEVDCANIRICKEAATKALNDCSALKSLGDCDMVSSLCFWSTNRNTCYSLSDVDNCPGFNQADCGKVKACKWEGDRCLNPLLKGVSDQYTKGYSKEKYPLFQSCVLDGSCRSLSNILYTVLAIVQFIFKYVGAIAFIFFVFGGFTMILSFGNAEKFKKGQQVLVAAVIGLIIVFGAYLMISFVLEALGVGVEFKAIK
mgnify:CR=1 FL=1